MECESIQCRVCKSQSLTDVINLGDQIITSRFPMIGDNSTPSANICLMQCNQCSLVQLKHTTDAPELYEHFYGYRSGINQTMRDHLRSYNIQLTELANVKEGDSVLDIGSNDRTFLSNYSKQVFRYGCDPTGIQFAKFYENESVTLLPMYFTKENIQSKLGLSLRFKAVSSISMFYDLPDPVQFAKDIYDLLDDEGIWTLEQSYVATMLERNSIDTICHEHIEYYGVKQIKTIMDLAGFKILNITLNECNGGSFRTYVSKRSSKFPEAVDVINSFLQKEEELQIHTPLRYTKFMNDCLEEVAKLNSFFEIMVKDNKSVYISG